MVEYKMTLRIFISSILLFLISHTVFAGSADVYLKNGSIIKNVTAYEKTKDKVILKVYGGILEIPEIDIIKIIEIEAPLKEDKEPAFTPTKPSVAEPEKTVKKVDELRLRLEAIDRRLQEIKTEEDEAQRLEKEYDEVRLIIEVLFQKGRRLAGESGKDISQWINFLTPDERFWVQTNTLKKEQLEKQKQKMKYELEPLLNEKQELLHIKKALEEQIASP